MTRPRTHAGPTNQNHAARHRAAFSLVELVVVLVVIAAVAAIATPRYARGLARYGADAAAARLAADLTQAAATARATSASQRIDFRLAQGKYRVSGVASLADNASVYVVDLRAGEYGVVIDMADCGGDTSLVFDGYGGADTGAVILIARGSEARKVEFDAASGEVYVTTISAPAYTVLLGAAPAGVRRGSETNLTALQ